MNGLYLQEPKMAPVSDCIYDREIMLLIGNPYVFLLVIHVYN